jgi:hypothetical protein
MLVKHEKVFSHSASGRSELLSVQGQVQVCLLEQPTVDVANLRVEHNKVAAVPLAIAAF